MNKGSGVNFILPPNYLNAAAIVSLLSVLVLVCLFFYLNLYTGRRYFSIWTVGWIFYALWLGLGPGLSPNPFQMMVKNWCVGVSAALLFWGSVQFLKLPSRPMLFCLFMGFLLVWSYVGAYHLKDPLQIGVPIFGVIGLASVVTAFSFYRLRKHRKYLGAGLLSFGFLLWGLYLGACPFFSRDDQMLGVGFLISAVLQLFIAVSMIVLVLEEARAANEMILSQIQTYRLEAQGLEAVMLREEIEYQGLFDRFTLGEKLRLAHEDVRRLQEKGLQRERLHALGQMSRGISHDINNALTPILGYSNLLLRGSYGLPESVVKYIQGIKTAGDKIAQSVSCIRDFYRKHEGREVLVKVELNELAQEMVEQMRAREKGSARSKGSGVVFKMELEPGFPQIMGQKSELREALTQLILNAVEAMPEGGGLDVRTGMRRTEGGSGNGKPADTVWVEVADQGIGMDEETRKRCLEPFFSTKDQQGSKGLGLSKVFGIMQRHQAQIEIESEKGKGTVMRLVFPAAQRTSEEPAATITDDAGPPLNVLCIDDEPSILDVIRIILKSGGHNVETALDGQSGLEKFRAAKAKNKCFDAVLTDLGMPRLDGHQVARLVKQECAKTPVIMLTGWGGIMQAEGNHPEYIDVILSKPPQVNELLDALRKVTAGG